MEFLHLVLYLLSILIFALVAYKYVGSFKLKHPTTIAKDVIAFNLIFMWFAIHEVLGRILSIVLYYIHTYIYDYEYIYDGRNFIFSQICWLIVLLLFAILTCTYARKLLYFEKHNAQKLFYFASVLVACVVLYQLSIIYNYATADAGFWESFSDYWVENMFLYGNIIQFINVLPMLYLVIRFLPFRRRLYQMYSEIEMPAESINITPNDNTSERPDGKPTKRCPYCGEIILEVAKKCKHCGEWLN